MENEKEKTNNPHVPPDVQGGQPPRGGSSKPQTETSTETSIPPRPMEEDQEDQEIQESERPEQDEER